MVEDIWCDFDHPAELNRFIRFMPAEDPVATRKRSVKENLRLMRAEWEECMKDLDQELTSKTRRPEV